MPNKKASTSKKKEIFMGLKLKVERAVPPVSAGAGRSKKAATPVFEKAKATCIEKLTQSIEDANGRYGSTEQEANPLPKAVRSVYWTVRHANDNLMEEQCEIAIRVGQSLWSCFEAEEGKKDSDKRYLVTADMLTPALQEIRSMIEGMDKDSAEGKSFHALAVESAGRRNKGTYNKTTDLFE